MTSPQTNYLHYPYPDSPPSTFWKEPAFWIGSSVALLGLAFHGRTRVALLGAGGALAAVRTRTKPTLSSHGTVLLQCSPEEAFEFWSDSRNIPRFMRNVHSVESAEDGHFRWTLRDASGNEMDTLVEFVTQKPSRIEWHSPTGAFPGLAGHIEFRPALADRGTIVSATVQYPRAAVGAGYWMMRLLERNPAFLATQDLRRFKALVETGEIPTTEGQSHGPRSWATVVDRSLDPDRLSPSKKTVSISEQRRIA